MHTAKSASEALKKLDLATPDVLLCDKNMPGIDGYQLLCRIRENPATKNIYMIGTGNFEPEEKHIPNAELKKPFEMKELEIMLQNYFNQTS